MGRLDPFFQELNGIGILALIVTIIAVIVRVVFCKTMRARIYTGVLGLISAIVMSLGIDYAIRPFAGTGESTATNGLGFVQLMIGVVIALIGGAVLRGILSHDDGEPQPTSNSPHYGHADGAEPSCTPIRTGGRHEQRGLLLWLVRDRPRQRRLPRPVV